MSAITYEYLSLRKNTIQRAKVVQLFHITGEQSINLKPANFNKETLHLEH